MLRGWRGIGLRQGFFKEEQRMQKKLLTMAVAGALAVPGLALAQSSVEVYGTINMSFGNVKYDSVGAAASVSKWDVASHASNYGLRGRESLGAGLTAWFQIEQNAPMERSNNAAITPASRNSAVGVQGAWVTCSWASGLRPGRISIRCGVSARWVAGVR